MKHENNVFYKVKALWALPRELPTNFGSEDSARDGAIAAAAAEGAAFAAFCVYRVQDGKKTAVKYSYSTGLSAGEDDPTSARVAGVWYPMEAST